MKCEYSIWDVVVGHGMILVQQLLHKNTTSRLVTTENRTHTEMQHHMRQEFTYINLIMLYKTPIIQWIQL